MDATSRKILGLMSEMNVRFVVPVYQRPYSWDYDQCAQLLHDIVACGRRKAAPHFTGSIVTIQDGSLSEQGVVPLLLIDGQQRITTITLLLVALARYAQAHPQARLPYTAEELARGGFLTNHFRTGADHYKLTLSKGDEPALRTLIDALDAGTAGLGTAGPDADVANASPRLHNNLRYFEQMLDELKDVGDVWAGLQRLEVVHISLAQGQDEPQLIFESMNSTGKDLSSADLVRNFVLMSYPLDEQREVYRVYWAPIENILGAHAYDLVFDDFIRSYLTVAQPLVCSADDPYRAFKRYVIARSYERGDRMRILALRLKRFARYYRAVTTGQVEDEAVAQALARVARLSVPAVNPLLLSLFDRVGRKTLTNDAFAAALASLESYLFRRAVCACENETLPDFVASLIARLDAVEEEEGDLLQALYVALLNESGARRFPRDAEFGLALRTLAERETLVEAASEEGDGADADRSFDILALAETDERMADDGALASGDGTLASGDGTLADKALLVWALPAVPEELLRAHRVIDPALAPKRAAVQFDWMDALQGSDDAQIILPWG